MQLNGEQCLNAMVETIKDVPLTEKQRIQIAIGLDGFRETLALSQELAKRLEAKTDTDDESTEKK